MITIYDVELKKLMHYTVSNKLYRAQIRDGDLYIVVKDVAIMLGYTLHGDPLCVWVFDDGTTGHDTPTYKDVKRLHRHLWWRTWWNRYGLPTVVGSIVPLTVLLIYLIGAWLE